MTVAEELAMLKNVIAEIKSGYCENCQEWDCDYCRSEMDSTESGVMIALNMTKKNTVVIDGKENR